MCKKIIFCLPSLIYYEQELLLDRPDLLASTAFKIISLVVAINVYCAAAHATTVVVLVIVLQQQRTLASYHSHYYYYWYFYLSIIVIVLFNKI